MTRAKQARPRLTRRFTLKRGSALFIWSALLARLVIPGQPAEAAMEGLKAPIFSSPATFFQQSFRRDDLSRTPVLAGPQAQNLAHETAKTTPSIQLTQQLIHGVKGVVSESPPLITEIAKTFEGQTYTPIVLQESLTVYRAEGSRFGRWFGLEKPDSAGMAERLYNIVDFGNDVMEVSTYDVPNGSVVYVGKVAGGEGHQVFIPNPKKVGVSLKQNEHLPQMGR